MFDELIATCGDQTPIGSLRVRNLTERLCLTIMDACFRSEDTALANLPEWDKTSLLSGVPSLTGAGLASCAIEKANPKIRPNYEILLAKKRRIRLYAVRLVSRRSLSAIMAMNSELVGLPR